MGMVFVSVGMIIAEDKIRLRPWQALTGFVISMLLFLAETTALIKFDITEYGDMYLFLLPACFFLFYIAVYWDVPTSAVYPFLRIAGTLMYFTHLAAMKIIDQGLRFAAAHGAPDLSGHSLLRYFCTAALTFIFSAVIIRLSRTERFRCLRWLYS